MTDATLHDKPELYELAAPANPLAETFYIEEGRRRGGAVLDLACGSGRYTIPLARSGLEVVGGDLSPSMLKRARTKATQQASKSISSRWICGSSTFQVASSGWSS